MRSFKPLAVACLAFISVSTASADEFIYYPSKARMSAPVATPVRAGAPVPSPAVVPNAPAGEQHSPPTLKQRFGPFQRSQRGSKHYARAAATHHARTTNADGGDAQDVAPLAKSSAPQITLVGSGKPLTYREAELAAREVADRENAAAAERMRLRQARQ